MEANPISDQSPITPLPTSQLLLQIYPTSVTPYTKIEEWYRAGLYKPYADEDGGEKLVEVLIWFKERVQVCRAQNPYTLHPEPWALSPEP